MPFTHQHRRRRRPLCGAASRFATVACAVMTAGNVMAGDYHADRGLPMVHDNQWRFTAELGFGLKHNNDGGLLLWRGRFGDDDWGGCGFVLGGWTGEWRNQVIGLNCETRVRLGWFAERRFFAGVGMVDIEPGTIVNSSWAFEIHLRYMLGEHTALSVTHYSNAGTHDPNRGFNFLSLEFIL